MDQFKVKEYKMHYVNRNSSKCKSGGILVYSNQHTVKVTQSKATRDSIMWLTVQLTTSDCHDNLIIGACYCAPESSKFSNSGEPFWDTLERDLLHKTGTNHVILMRDFNARTGTCWTTLQMGRECS